MSIGKVLIKGVLAVFAALPLKVHYGFSAFISRIAVSVLGYRRDEVVANLARCFPEKNYHELTTIRKQFYRHFADIVVEAIWFGGCRKGRRLRKAGIVKVINPQSLIDLYEKSPSVMVLYTHCGNWELLGGIKYYFDGTTPVSEDNYCVLYKEMSDKNWDSVMRDNRFAPLDDRDNFPGYLESKSFVRYAFTHRDEKKIYNSNTDQRPYYEGSDNLEVTFLGQQVRSMSASAAIARKFGWSVCFQKMSIASRGHYEIEYIPICEDASKMSVQAIMDRYYELLDDEIREQPYNYLWTHRRWMR